MSITWTRVVDQAPAGTLSRILGLDRVTGFVAVAWFEEDSDGDEENEDQEDSDEERKGTWVLHDQNGDPTEVFPFTHWAPIQLPMRHI